MPFKVSFLPLAGVTTKVFESHEFAIVVNDLFFTDHSAVESMCLSLVQNVVVNLMVFHTERMPSGVRVFVAGTRQRNHQMAARSTGTTKIQLIVFWF